VKESNLLTIASLFSLLLLTFHLTGDIIFGWERGGLANLAGVTVIGVVWLYGVLMFRERLPGYIVALLGGLLSVFVPYIHMSGKGVGVASRMAGYSGHFFFVWSLLMLGVSGLFAAILSARGLWSLRSRRKQVE
jgi:hypothetical protein